MNSDTWGPLLGVVVGAVLGGGAQIVDSHLSGRRGRKDARREIRRATYVELLRACSQLNNDVVIVRHFQGDAGRGFPDLVASVNAVRNAQAELVLVAPEDTERAGEVMINLYMKQTDTDSDDLRTKAGVARDLFVTYAQRDLGYGPGFRRETLKERWRKQRKKDA